MTSKRIIFPHLSFFIQENILLKLYYCPSEDNVKIILFFHMSLCKKTDMKVSLWRVTELKAMQHLISHISKIWPPPPDVLQGFPSNLQSVLIFEHLNPFLHFWKSPQSDPPQGDMHITAPSIIVTRSLRLHHLINSSWAVGAVLLHLYPCRIELELQDGLRNYLLFKQGQHSDSLLVTLCGDPLWWNRFTLYTVFQSELSFPLWNAEDNSIKSLWQWKSMSLIKKKTFSPFGLSRQLNFY